MKLPFRFNTIFARMFIFNILLVILATIIPQAVFFNYLLKKYDEDTKNYNMKNALEMKNYVDDTILEKVVNIPNIHFSQLHSNDDLTFPMENDVRSLPTRILAVSRKISDINNAMEFLDSIDVFYRKGGLLFINTNAYFLDGIATGNSYVYEWLSRYKESASKTSWFTNERVSNGVERYVTAFKRNIPYNADSSESQAIVVINIKQASINKYIKSMDLQHGEELLIISGEDGKIVAHPNAERIGTDISRHPIGQFVLGAEERDTADLKNDGKLITVSFVKSGYNNWIYVSVVSNDAMYQKNRQMILYVLALCILAFFVNITMSFVFTKGAYKPFSLFLKKINSLYKIFHEDETGSTENEYKLLDRTINNLAENIDEINAKLEANKPIIYHNTMLRLLGGTLRPGNLKEIERLIGLRLGKNCIFSFVIKMYPDNDLGFENRMLVNYSILEVLGKARDGIQVESIPEDDKTIAGFVSFDMPEQKKEIYEQLYADMGAVVKAKLIFCIGRTYARGEDAISQSYMEACECHKYVYFMPQKYIVAHEELAASQRNDSKNQVRLLNRLEDSIKSSNEAEFNAAMDSMAGALMTGLYHIDYSIYVLNSIISTVKTALISMDMDEVDIFGFDLREQMQDIDNISDFRIWMNDIFSVICLKRQNLKTSIINNELEQKIISYIDENIYNNVSLDNISKALNISSYYLSRNFKVLMGMNFSEYLSEKKMQCAESLLLESGLAVKEIAYKLGYNSIQHFIKLFKAKYVLTPKEYQKKMRGSPCSENPFNVPKT